MVRAEFATYSQWERLTYRNKNMQSNTHLQLLQQYRTDRGLAAWNSVSVVPQTSHAPVHTCGYTFSYRVVYVHLGKTGNLHRPIDL